jgi:hypothetical protein
MDQNAKQEKMKCNRHGRVPCAAVECCDWFADRLDACSLLSESYFVGAGYPGNIVLDAGEGGLLFLVVTFRGEGKKAIDQLFVR